MTFHTTISLIGFTKISCILRWSKKIPSSFWYYCIRGKLLTHKLLQHLTLSCFNYFLLLTSNHCYYYEDDHVKLVFGERKMFYILNEFGKKLQNNLIIAFSNRIFCILGAFSKNSSKNNLHLDCDY